MGLVGVDKLLRAAAGGVLALALVCAGVAALFGSLVGFAGCLLFGYSALELRRGKTWGAVALFALSVCLVFCGWWGAAAWYSSLPGALGIAVYGAYFSLLWKRDAPAAALLTSAAAAVGIAAAFVLSF